MPSSNPKEKELHKSPSVLKLLGKRLLNSNKHTNEPSYTVIASGNSIAPLRKRTTSPHVSGAPTNPTTNTSSTIPHPPSKKHSDNNNNETTSTVSRHRSPSLVSRLRGTSNKDVNSNTHPVKSSVSLADLTAHNTNPFVMTPLHDNNNNTNINNPNNPNLTLKKRSTGGEIHRAKSTSLKKGTAGGAHTHHLATPSRSKSFMEHQSTSNNNNSSSNIFNLPAEKVVYNPYGINSRPGTAFGNENNNNDLSFYLHDGNAKIRMLPLPIEDPNKFLPEEMKQYSIHLTDNFIFDTENKPIGSGGSSEVRKIRSSYRQKDVYALKKLNMIYNETPEKFYKRCSKEFIIAKYLSHNIHIMPTFLLVKVPTTTYTTRGWGFIMELGVKDLFELIERTGWKSVPITEKWCLFKQIAQGVKFCHDNGIAHRDLKPENVLITKDGICKLTDFGISDWYHTIPRDFSSPVKKCEGMIGSPPFTPPEVMYWDAKKHYPERFQQPYDPLAMDCYALGIMLFTLINGIVPFIESCNQDARFREFETSYENYIRHQNPHFRDKNHYKPGPGGEFSLARNFKSTNGTRIAWRLSDPNPKTRYTMEDLFNDPWFQAAETCVDPNDERYTSTRVPEIRKSTSNDGTFFLNDHENSTDDLSSNKSVNIQSPVGQHTSNPFPVALVTSPQPPPPTPRGGPSSNDQKSVETCSEKPPSTVAPTRVKPRSMVDIATSPMKTTKNAVKGGHSLAMKSGSKLLKGGSSLLPYNNENGSGSGNNSSRSSTATPTGKEVLFSVPETDKETDSTSASSSTHKLADTDVITNNVDSILEETTPKSPTIDEDGGKEEKMVKDMNGLSIRGDNSTHSIMSTPASIDVATSSASSIKSGKNTTLSLPSQKKRLVVHHHLDVPSSVTAGTSMTLRSLMSG